MFSLSRCWQLIFPSGIRCQLGVWKPMLQGIEYMAFNKHVYRNSYPMHDIWIIWDSNLSGISLRHLEKPCLERESRQDTERSSGAISPKDRLCLTRSQDCTKPSLSWAQQQICGEFFVRGERWSSAEGWVRSLVLVEINLFQNLFVVEHEHGRVERVEFYAVLSSNNGQRNNMIASVSKHR